MVLMSSLITVNQYQYVVRCVSSVVVYWTHVHEDTGLNLGQVKFFVLLPSCYHTLYKELPYQNFVFSENL
jgi:hypothetical protein